MRENRSLGEGLSDIGTIDSLPPAEGPAVIVIRDRHTIHGSITRARDELFDVRRENAAAVSHLVRHGFTLLACEAPLGELSTDELANAHRRAYREAVLEQDDVNAWTIYQPIRFEEEHRGRLSVRGVEDPTLYREDAESLERIQGLRGLLARNDIPASESRRAYASYQVLASEIISRAAERGRRSADNLSKLLKDPQHARAILLLGGAHCDAAAETLRNQGHRVTIFQCRSYSRGSLESVAGRAARRATSLRALTRD